MKLRTKIISMFSLLITICFLVFFLIVQQRIEHTNRTLTESLSTQVINSTAGEAGFWLGQRISELRMIALSDPILEEDIDAMRSYIRRLNSSIGTSFGNEWGTFAIGLTDGLGWVSDEITIDVSERDYFKDAMSTDAEYVLSSPVVSKTDEAPIVLICYPLRNQQGRTFGFLNGAVSLKKLTELVKEIDFYEGTSWIMNSDGIPYTETATYLDAQMLTDLVPILRDNPSASTMQWVAEHQNKTIFYTAIPSTENWFLCTAVDQDMLMKDTRKLHQTILTAWLALLAVSVFFCILLSRSLTRPILKLTGVMETVHSGNVQIRANVTGNHEISILARTFNQMLDTLQELMERIRQEEREKRKAEFRVLQSQINPHFLYNTLDTLQWKAYDHEDNEMVDLITALSSFFRISLSKGEGIISLDREIEHVKNYLFIQQIRFQETLSYDVQCNIHPEQYSIVKLTLQPLVENAIQHGIKPKLCACRITITIDRDGDCLVLNVFDDGVGISTERLAKLQNQLNGMAPAEGFGLYNVQNRLNLVYGEDYGLTLSSEEGVGTCVTVRIPVTKGVSKNV